MLCDKRRFFKIVGVVAALTAVALLAAILAPILGDALGLEARAVKRTAEQAHEAYLSEGGTASEWMLYDAGGAWIALRDGKAEDVCASREEALQTILSKGELSNMRAHGVSNGLYAVEPMKAVICFTFDDGNATDSDIYEMFRERGLVCSFALNTSGAAKDRLAQYLPYQEEGFEILSHSVSHAAMDQLGKSSIWVENEMKTSKQILEAAGFRIRSWVTPNSTLHESYLDLLKQYYESGATVYRGAWNEGGEFEDLKPYNVLTDDPCCLYRIGLEKTTRDRCKLAIDEAVANQGLLSFYAHGFNRYATGISREELADILDYVLRYAESGQCIVATVSDGVDYFYHSAPYAGN